MILLITSPTLHKHYNLILALQLYINRRNVFKIRIAGLTPFNLQR